MFGIHYSSNMSIAWGWLASHKIHLTSVLRIHGQFWVLLVIEFSICAKKNKKNNIHGHVFNAWY